MFGEQAEMPFDDTYTLRLHTIKNNKRFANNTMGSVLEVDYYKLYIITLTYTIPHNNDECFNKMPSKCGHMCGPTYHQHTHTPALNFILVQQHVRDAVVDRENAPRFRTLQRTLDHVHLEQDVVQLLQRFHIVLDVGRHGTGNVGTDL